MIAALGCKYVILGHSERRQYYGETSATLNKKMAQAYANGLTPIYCVGENLEEREAGKHFDVVKAQIEEVVYNLTPEQFGKLVIAYEPVWGIGTGKTATAEQAQALREEALRVLPERVRHFAARMGVSPASVRVTAARTRFGSCSSQGHICFSWRLMQYPPEAIDYVVVHELAHLRYMNHGAEFYALIARYLPDWKARRALLQA